MAKRIHGLSRHPLYSVWNQMRQRCVNKAHPMYKWYGRRGITVCERWLNSFPAFIEDMGSRMPGYTLERIDNNGNYSPENCRWATRSEQAKNRAPMGAYLSTEERAKWKRNLIERLSIQGKRPRPGRRIKPTPCTQCGNLYIHHGGHAVQKYCSRKCYGAAMKRPDRICEFCAVQFRPKVRITTARFCSLRCSARHREASRAMA